MVKSICEAVNADPMGWSDYTDSRLNRLLLFLLGGRLGLAGLLADAALSLEGITGLFADAAFLFANTFRWHSGLLA
jgi:hypothetical protein